MEGSGLPQVWRMGRMLGLNNHNEMFVSRLMPRVGVPPQIPFRQSFEKVKIGIFLNANHLTAYLKGAVRVVGVNKGKRDARITLEIPELLAGFGLTETERVPISVEPDRGALRLTFRSDGCYMCQCRCTQQICTCPENICHQRLFPFIRGDFLHSTRNAV